MILGQCGCKDLMSSNGHGNCQTTSSYLSDKLFCYVIQPSPCSDLQDSNIMPGEKYSAEACSSQGGVIVNSIT